MSNSIASRVSNASMLVYRRDVVVVVVVEVMPTAALGLAAIAEQQCWNPHVEEETSARMKAVKNVDVYNMLSTNNEMHRVNVFSWEVGRYTKYVVYTESV